MMRLYYSPKGIAMAFLFSLLGNFLYSQCTVTGPADVSIPCNGSTTFAATTSFVTYSVVTTSCSPVAISGTNAFPTACDDCVTGQIPIGFPFNFYGNVYNSVVISSNGIAGFGPFTYTGYVPWTIPNSGIPNNYIAGFFADIDIRYGGTITYQMVGTAPNRRFVISYNNVVPYYNGASAGTGTASFQIVLNEDGSFNVIVSQLSANWNSGTSGALATSGAEDNTGTYAFPVPGRNATDWPGITPANNDCTLFNPSPCIFQRWEVGGTTFSTNPSITVTPATTTNYVAVWNCGGNTCTDGTLVTVSTPPTTTSASMCAGGTAATLTSSACSSGGTITWYTAASGGSSIGTGSPFNPIGVAGSGIANSSSVGSYTFYSECSNAPGCRTPATYVISPSSTAPSSVTGGTTICNGMSANLGITGGTLASGSQWQWYSGSCGGTPVGTGATLAVTPAATTTYFVQATAASGCPASACVSATVTLPTAGTTLANNTDAATCLVNQNGYVHFYHSSGRLIASVNSNGQNLGNVTATAYVGTPLVVNACLVPSYYVTALGRHWVITPQFQPAAAVTIALPYDNAEFTTLQTTANANTSPYDNLTAISDLRLSKYHGPANVDAIASNNCLASGGNGGTTIHTNTANGNVTAIIPGFSATARYSRFNIPSFSELWLHGSLAGSPLPVELSSFNVACAPNNEAGITWTTESENNCYSYGVERSDNGSVWSEVAEVSCTGAGTYTVKDPNRLNGISYYRLRQTDVNGAVTVYDPVSLSCSSSGMVITAYPNPASDKLNVQLSSPDDKGEVTVELTDVTGKVIQSRKAMLNAGTTNLPYDTEELSAGTYYISIRSAEEKINPVKIIIQH